MEIRESSFGYWSHQPGFLAVTFGAALGIGNSMRLPYLMSEYGGYYFLGFYLLSLILVALPILVAEWALGRWMRDELGSGFARLSQEAGARRMWKWLGRLSVIGAALILSYYSVIAGWSLGYLFRGAGGALAQGDPGKATGTFLRLAQDPERSLAWHTLFMVVVTVTVSYGFRDGIERAASILIPVIAVMCVAFISIAYVVGAPEQAIQTITQSNSAEFGWRGAVEAVYHAFFTLGLGLGVMMTLGSYLPSNVPLVRLGILVILADCIFGLIVGTGLVAVLSQAGLAPANGLALIFQSFPQALPANAHGMAMAILFYMILFLVTLLAGAVLLEPITRLLMERHRQTRVFAATGAAILVWFLGLGSLLSFSSAAELKVLGYNFFEWVQFATSFVLVPVAALLICIYASRILPAELGLAVWGPREQGLFRLWRLALRYPARIALVVILLYGMGLLDRIASFWA